MEKIVHKEDIVEYKDFLSKQECEDLIDYFNSSEDDWNVTCFYASYVMDPNASFENKNNTDKTPEYFNELKTKLRNIAEEVSPKKLKNLSLSAHKWTPGAFAAHHSDNTELDGTPNAWQDNKFVTIIYLNDNYDGGNLLFNAHGISISPSAGTVIAFDPGFTNLHGVSEVTNGVRYTILSSFDHVDSVYTRDLFEWRKEYSKEQEEQRKEWEKNNHF
jgi:2OG-Fe(II) oxygenase superfamily